MSRRNCFYDKPAKLQVKNSRNKQSKKNRSKKDILRTFGKPNFGNNVAKSEDYKRRNTERGSGSRSQNQSSKGSKVKPQRRESVTCKLCEERERSSSEPTVQDRDFFRSIDKRERVFEQRFVGQCMESNLPVKLGNNFLYPVFDNKIEKFILLNPSDNSITEYIKRDCSQVETNGSPEQIKRVSSEETIRIHTRYLWTAFWTAVVIMLLSLLKSCA